MRVHSGEKIVSLQSKPNTYLYLQEVCVLDIFFLRIDVSDYVWHDRNSNAENGNGFDDLVIIVAPHIDGAVG